MRISGVRPFLRNYLNALGLREWRDGFNFENIPSSILNKSYHLEVGTITSGATNQLHHEFDLPIVLRVFLKGFRNPGDAVDASLDLAQDILETLLNPSVRLQVNGLKDIRPSSILPQALSMTNDNSIVLEMNFDLVLIYCFKNTSQGGD